MELQLQRTTFTDTSEIWDKFHCNIDSCLVHIATNYICCWSQGVVMQRACSNARNRMGMPVKFLYTTISFDVCLVHNNKFIGSINHWEFW